MLINCVKWFIKDFSKKDIQMVSYTNVKFSSAINNNLKMIVMHRKKMGDKMIKLSISHIKLVYTI